MKREKSLWIVVWLTLVSMTVVRLTYASTRDVFLSGPDANGFIPAAKGFALQKFLSDQIEFQPQYPPGYPFILSLVIRLFGFETSLDFNWKLESWMLAAQSLQVIALLTSTIVFMSILKKWEPQLSSKEQFFLTMLFILHPALSIASVEAMYEIPFLLFTLLAINQLIHLKNQKEGSLSIQFLLSGLFMGIAIAIHPRAIVLFCLSLVILHIKKKFRFQDLIFLLLTAIWIPGIFSLRNFFVYKQFTLSSPGAWQALQSQEFLSGCVDMKCLLTRVLHDPVGFVSQTSINVAHFWTPYSGTMTRGTWYHNVSIQRFLEKLGWTDMAILISVLFSIANLLLFFIGSQVLVRTRNRIGLVFVFGVLYSLFIDALVYGDSRHRLVSAPFIIVVNYVGLSKFLQYDWVVKQRFKKFGQAEKYDV